MDKVPNEPKIVLSDHEWRINVRPLRMEDFDALIAMEAMCFPGMAPWTREQIESQLKVFPEGQFCVEVDGKLAASCSSLILEYDPDLAWHNWKAVADGGYLRNHNPKGDTLYGIEMMVRSSSAAASRVTARMPTKCPPANTLRT
jgi:ribosomal protein S18 acetylase RimI-like enzyme